MKRFIAFALILTTFVLALASCGSSGDTNMHKIMDAVDDGIITSDDAYVFQSMEGFQSTDNKDYSEVRASCNGINPKQWIGFHASNLTVVKDTSKNGAHASIKWRAEEGEITYKDQTVSMAANTVSMEVEYTPQHWDSARNEWMVDDIYMALVYGFNMDDYYQNGSFSAANVTTIGDSECTDVAVALLNDAFDGLNGIFTEKGYPIK